MTEKPLTEYKNQKLVFNTSGKIIPGQKTVMEIHQETMKLSVEIKKWLEDVNKRNS